MGRSFLHKHVLDLNTTVPMLLELEEQEEEKIGSNPEKRRFGR